MKLESKTETCKNCQDPIRLNDDGVWVTSQAVEFDLCNGETVHAPAPETTACENGCGTEVTWSFNEEDRYCERCVAEYEQQMRDQEWDYRQ